MEKATKNEQTIKDERHNVPDSDGRTSLAWELKRRMRRRGAKVHLRLTAPEKWRILIKFAEIILQKYEGGRQPFARASEVVWNKEKDEVEHLSAYVSIVLREFIVAGIIEPYDRFDKLSPLKFSDKGINYLLGRLTVLEDELNHSSYKYDDYDLWINRIKKFREILNKLKSI